MHIERLLAEDHLSDQQIDYGLSAMNATLDTLNTKIEMLTQEYSEQLKDIEIWKKVSRRMT